MSESPSDALQPSELGTKEFWEARYTQEIDNFNDHGDEGEVWFGSSSETRIAQHFQTKKLFKSTRVIDLGCGNGSMLRRLRRLGYTNLTGVDYCSTAVTLARSIDTEDHADAAPITYSTLDLCVSTALPTEWLNSYDIAVDKGTLDAIALSDGAEENLRNYLRNARTLFDNDAGSFVICSCNFTEGELVKLVENGHEFRFNYSIDAKSSFQFGGKTGQTTCVCVFDVTK